MPTACPSLVADEDGRGLEDLAVGRPGEVGEAVLVSGRRPRASASSTTWLGPSPSLRPVTWPFSIATIEWLGSCRLQVVDDHLASAAKLQRERVGEPLVEVELLPRSCSLPGVLRAVCERTNIVPQSAATEQTFCLASACPSIRRRLGREERTLTWRYINSRTTCFFWQRAVSADRSRPATDRLTEFHRSRHFVSRCT